jgi:rSAM/selenodomain-associated transferase 2
MLTVIVPALNAAGGLAATLAGVAGGAGEVIVVDGGSDDATVCLARSLGARVIIAPRGRGTQLAAGIAAATGDWLLLLHADTVLAPGWAAAAQTAMAMHGRAAFFRFALASSDRRARWLERLVAWRCRWLALPYGDQGLLLSRALLDAVGGMRPLPLMEDIDLVRRLGRRRLLALDVAAVTSAERWERDGWVWRSARNMLCLALYLCGLPLGLIVRLYAGRSRAG